MILEKIEDFKATIGGSKITVVDFFAEWCGPCKVLGPIFENVAKKNADKANFLKINVDNFSDLAAEYNIQSIPTIIYFKDGIEVERSLGVVSETNISDKIDSLL